jgi:hypothetical protein
MGKFAEQAPDVEIALADRARLAFAGRLLVARTDGDPGREPVRAAENAHVGTDFIK